MKEIFALLKEHFGWDEKKAAAWMVKPQPRLGGITPEKYLEMHGFEKFEQWLTHVEYYQQKISVDHKEAIRAEEA